MTLPISQQEKRNPLIQRLEHFTRLSAEDRRALDELATTKIRKLGPHEDVIREGEKPTSVTLVLEGWLCRYKDLEDGRRQIIAFFLPGDLCDLNIFVFREMDHSIGAITAATIAEIPRGTFDKITTDYPRVTQALLWQTLVGFAIQREWTVNIGQRDARERMAHLICEIFLRLRMVGLTDGDHCAFPLVQSELADAMGLSIVHVNRTLQQLRQEGLIILKDKSLTVPDLQALMDTALFNVDYLHLDREGKHLDANN